MWADPEVVRFIGGKPLSQQEVWAKFLRNGGHWQLLGFGYWVVRERETDRFVGEVGLGNFQARAEPAAGRDAGIRLGAGCECSRARIWDANRSGRAPVGGAEVRIS